MYTEVTNPLSIKEQHALLAAAYFGDLVMLDSILGRLPTKQQQKQACNNTRYTWDVISEAGRIDYRINFSETPLHFACERGNIAIVNALCRQWGAEPNTFTGGKLHSTPFSSACWYGHNDVVTELCKMAGMKGVEAITKHRNYDGSTPLHEACCFRRICAIKMLWEIVGVNRMEWWDGEKAPKDNRGQTPLDMANPEVRTCFTKLQRRRAVKIAQIQTVLCAWHPRLGVNSTIHRLGVPLDVAHYIINVIL